MFILLEILAKNRYTLLQNVASDLWMIRDANSCGQVSGSAHIRELESMKTKTTKPYQANPLIQRANHPRRLGDV